MILNYWQYDIAFYYCCFYRILYHSFFRKDQEKYYPRQNTLLDKNTLSVSFARNQKKPQWVVNKVLYLKAVSCVGCGSVANMFNQRYGHKVTVSKSFVYEKLKSHQYQLHVIKRGIKQKPPKKIPINNTWGLDLTQVKLSKKQSTILGLILGIVSMAHG